jgi:Protein of unknown function (DUF4236)
MSWRFRQSFSPLPGVRITLSPSGISTSVGVGPIRLTAGPKGPAVTARLPGTGISFRQSLASGGSQREVYVPNVKSTLSLPTLEEIKSAGSSGLTTPGLAEFKRLLEQTKLEHGEISRDLAHWREEEKIASRKFVSWQNGWLLRRLLKAKFQRLRLTAEEFSARRAELEEQETLSRLKTQLELPEGVIEAFHQLSDKFVILARALCIWDTVGQRSTNRVAERTTATRVIDRKRVSFQLGKCELIESEWSVPHLENSNGGDVYFYPAFVLYFVTAENFALLEYKDIKLNFSDTRFIEEDTVPADSKIVGNTWAKANKDGTPDKRFNGNYQIPIVQYGKLVITSETGMNEEYMISNPETTEVFARSWQSLANAVNFGI